MYLDFFSQSYDTEFYDYIEIGDTVISEKNSLKALVRNKGKNKLFDFSDY